MELINLLGAGGVEVDMKLGGGTGTPLWWAARGATQAWDGEGAVKLATLLVEKGADVNAVGADNEGHESTPLWWAAQGAKQTRSGAVELAKLLVEMGADVNAIGAERDMKCTPLWWAAMAAWGATKLDSRNWDSRPSAVELATLLVEKGADVNAVGADNKDHESTPLWWATQAYRTDGAVELAKLLVEHGADVNAIGAERGMKCTPLCIALYRSVEVVSRDEAGSALQLATFLVEHGADVNAVGSFEDTAATPLWLAAYAYTVEDNWEGGFDMVKLLVEKDAGVNTVGEADGESRDYWDYGGYKCAPLWLAAKAVYDGRARAVEMATLLVHKGADANEVGEGGRQDESTPLRRAGRSWRDF